MPNLLTSCYCHTVLMKKLEYNKEKVTPSTKVVHILLLFRPAKIDFNINFMNINAE